MAIADADTERNAAATRRLHELAAGLTDDDLARPLGGGWTVAVALAHLAFWDGRHDAALRHFADTGVVLDEDDAANAGLEPLAQHLDPRAAASLALSAAERVDATVEQLTADARAAIVAGDHDYMVRRWQHREEHIAQIERAQP